METWFDNSIETDPRKHYYLRPTAIINVFGSVAGYTENLLAGDDQNTVFSSAGCTGVILDFGQEISGGIEIKTSLPVDKWSAKIRVRFGESVSEVLHDPNNDHSIHDWVNEITVLSTYQVGDTGFRFVRIDLLSEDASLNIKSVRAIARELPLEYKGSFESSDELLNDIWMTGARTVHLCCQDVILDGIKRDRLLWVGDLHPQIHTIASVFGDIDIVAKTLKLAPDTCHGSRWMNNGFASYSLWWLVCLWDWYFYSGNSEILTANIKHVKEILENINTCIDADGSEHYDCERFIDWPTSPDKDAISQGHVLLSLYALNAVSSISQVLNDTELKQKSNGIQARLKNITLPPTENQQINSLKMLLGLTDKNLVSGKPTNMSTWYFYYMLQAKAMVGDIEGSLDLIRQFWGGMLSLGAITFWEHFDLDWLDNASRIDQMPEEGRVDVHKELGQYCYQGHRQSLCHGWSAGPTAWLSRCVLGIVPLTPGCSKVKISPNLGNLDYAKGSIPTPHGDLYVEHRKEDGKIVTRCSVPDGVELES